jgi:hypothetical protein
MKTIKITNMFLAVAIVAISLVSCEKTDQPATSLTIEDGIIQDLGSINDSTRIMQSELTSQSYVLTNLYSNTPGAGAKIKVSFFSKEDGKIPSGNYTCSAYSDKLPFTFSDATFELPDNFYKQGVFSIINGSVSVSVTGSRYKLVFDGELSNGESFIANYEGVMNYSDHHK